MEPVFLPVFLPSTDNFNTNVETAIKCVDTIANSIRDNDARYDVFRNKFVPIAGARNKWDEFIERLPKWKDELKALTYKTTKISAEMVSTKMRKIFDILQSVRDVLKNWVEGSADVLLVDDSTYAANTFLDVIKQIDDCMKNTNEWSIFKRKKNSGIRTHRKGSRAERREKQRNPKGVHMKPGGSKNHPVKVPEGPRPGSSEVNPVDITEDRPLRVSVGRSAKIHPEPTDENELGDAITNIVMTKLEALGVSGE